MKTILKYIQNRKWSTSVKPYSNLIIRGDGADWVLSELASELKKTWGQLGITVLGDEHYFGSRRQCIYVTSKYILRNWKRPKNRIAIPYFHGNPSLDKANINLLNNLARNHHEISRIQVSCSLMSDVVCNTGIDPKKVFKIPIAVDPSFFTYTTNYIRKKIRTELGIPLDAVVIGSFQKDGLGFEEGSQPKLIKGPDILLEVLAQLQVQTKNIYVLLTGPARGFVKHGLERHSIPYKHFELDDYSAIGRCYNALDLYLVTSREEGGPRAVLESMASGIPIVSTCVGQAQDLINHGINGWVTDVGDVEALVFWAHRALEDATLRNSVRAQALNTVANNTHEAHLPLWKEFMENFVE